MNDSFNYLGAAHWAVHYTATTTDTAKIIKFVKTPTDMIPTGAPLPGGAALTASGAGSTTTVVSAGRPASETTDYWKGKLIKFTSGTNNGLIRLITGFNDGTDTWTFAPAVSVATANLDTFELYTASYTNRLIVTGYQISCINTNAAEAQVRIFGLTTAAILLAWAVPRTTGVMNESCSNLWLPLPADEHLALTSATLTTGPLRLTVFGRQMPSTTHVSEKYDMSA